MKSEKSKKIRPGPPSPVPIDAVSPSGGMPPKKPKRKPRRIFFEEQEGAESTYMRKG